MKQYYDKQNQRLIYCGQKANDSFWDEHWDRSDLDFEKSVRKNNRFIIKTTRKYLPAGSRVLEGGCGQSANVFTLHHNGYRACGIDYAAETIKKINRLIPELDIRLGDVRNLPFEDEYFDGYWSLGVIEHLFDGFDPIIKEAHRTLKEDGYLFVTCPCMNFIRRFRASRSCYPLWQDEENAPELFYQFALNKTATIEHICEAGFQLCSAKRFDGVKGFKDEIASANNCLQLIYNNDSLPAKITRKIMDLILSAFAGHSILLVFQKH